MTLSLAIELALSTLLAVTLVYCALLERRLVTLRRGQDGVKQTIQDLTAAIAAASQAISNLKTSAANASGILDERLARARGMADELSLLAASGERIATRIAGQCCLPPASDVLSNRLRTLRPEALGGVR